MLMDIIKARHSIRKYTGRQVSVINDPGMKNGFYGAPSVVAVFAQDNFLFRIADAFCCAENMVLQATELGISSCVIFRGESAGQTIREYKWRTHSRMEVIFNVCKDVDYEIYKERLVRS